MNLRQMMMNGIADGVSLVKTNRGSDSAIIVGTRMLRQRATAPPSHLITKEGGKKIQKIVFHFV
jgi:hypothetical protein